MLHDPANILIVDDRHENLFATEAVLKTLQAKIFTADSGSAALELMLLHRFAVVILAFTQSSDHRLRENPAFGLPPENRTI